MLGDFKKGEFLWDMAEFLMVDMVQGFVAEGIMKEMAGVCFTADTGILTESGLIPIVDIKVGDVVWAYNEKTGNVELSEVVKTFINHTDEIVEISINDEIICTTLEHPFYVYDTGWVGASVLKAGDKIIDFDAGEPVAIDNIQIVIRPETVYNF